jgi:hypothetical protein
MKGFLDNLYFCLFGNKKEKNGEMTIEELGKIVLAVVFLALLVFIVFFLIKVNGGKVFEAIKNLVRFGGR